MKDIGVFSVVFVEGASVPQIALTDPVSLHLPLAHVILKITVECVGGVMWGQGTRQKQPGALFPSLLRNVTSLVREEQPRQSGLSYFSGSRIPLELCPLNTRGPRSMSPGQVIAGVPGCATSEGLHSSLKP